MPGTLNNKFLMDVWLNNHFPCKDLESSNGNNHFKADVSGPKQILCCQSLSPFPLFYLGFDPVLSLLTAPTSAEKTCPSPKIREI